MQKLWLLVPLMLSNACSDDKKRDEGSSSSNVAIELGSSQLGLTQTATTSCTVQVDATTVPGLCLTPLAVTGSFSTVQLWASSTGRPIRILGGGSEQGPANIFKHADFDLTTSPAIQGDDNIQDGSADTSYTYLAIQAQQVEFAFQATASNKVYHVRTLYANAKPSTESAFASSSCRLSSALAEADGLGTLITGLEALAGDILVCVKSSSSETCADSDYRYVDSSGALVSTRPASPKAQTSTGLIKTSSCPADGANWGYTEFNLAFTTPFKVSASFGEGGVKTYQSGDKSGSKLTFSMDVDLQNGLFIPGTSGITDLATVNEAAILNNIGDILLKSQFIRKNRPNSSAGETSAMLKATPTLKLENN